MIPGTVIKQNGKVMIYLHGENPMKCLALDEDDMLEVIDVDENAEVIDKYENITIMLKNRLFYLNDRYGG